MSNFYCHPGKAGGLPIGFKPLVPTLFVYGLVWLVMRLRKLKMSGGLHASAILGTFVISGIVRLVSMATVGGKGAYDLSSAGQSGLYLLLVPAVVAAFLINFLVNGHDQRTMKLRLQKELPPLIIAASEGALDKLNLLLGDGVDPNVAGPDGQTALMLAARNGHKEAVSLLLSRGAARELKTRSGNNAADIALKFGHSDVFELLR